MALVWKVEVRNFYGTQRETGVSGWQRFDAQAWLKGRPFLAEVMAQAKALRWHEPGTNS